MHSEATINYLKQMDSYWIAAAARRILVQKFQIQATIRRQDKTSLSAFQAMMRNESEIRNRQVENEEIAVSAMLRLCHLCVAAELPRRQ